MKKITFNLILVCLVAITAKAQIGGNAIYNGSNANDQYGNGGYSNGNFRGVNLNPDPYNAYAFHTVLEASVMANVKASSFVAIFAISQHAASIEEADQLMEARINLFKSLAKEAQLDPSQIFTDPVSLVPTYEFEVVNKKYSKTLNELPSGFEMKKNLHITFKQHEQINRIISIAAKAEIYDLVKADYVIDNLEGILAGLREDAIGILVAKKNSLEKAGIHARFTQMAEKYGSAYPIERYQQYYAYRTGTPKSYAINYAKSTVRQVQYNYAEKNKTIYYDKVSDKQFDKVINPVVGEPMVQVYISVKSQYQVFDPLEEADTKAYNKRMRDIGEKEALLRLLEKEKLIEQIGKKPAVK